MPAITLGAQHARYAQAVPIMQKVVNFFLPETGLANVMEECGADVVNAAGLCAAIMQVGLATGQIQMVKAPQTVSERYRAYRISPAQLLWPTDFKGSDWQRARWLGYDATMPWALAKDEFHLDDGHKDDVCGTQGSEKTTRTLAGESREPRDYTEEVHYTVIFYWAALCYPDEKRYDAIRRRVFVEGIDEAVIDEPYAGQVWNEQTKTFVGCTRLPIEVVCLTYVSDMAIPPSDSEIGRPMVFEQMRSRSQMILQRTRNLPLRTVDTNRVDPMILDLVMRGIWQGIIPVNGPGERVFAQIAAAAFPKEDFSFDAVSNRDLDDAWSMSPNQLGNYNTGERSASEAQFVQGAYASVIGFQRQKIVNFFLGLIDTLMGLLQLNLDNFELEPVVGPDGVQRLQQWDRQKIDGKFVATVRQDATVLQDTGARTRQLMQFLNIAGKSGRIQIDPIIAELASLSGLDPATVMAPPAQPKPEPLQISYRMTGMQDLLNPLALSFLVKNGLAPGPGELEYSKQLLLDAAAPPKNPPPAESAAGPDQPQGPGPVGGAPMPPPGPNPDWAAMPRVTKRPEELGG
jgi:hypothetical protein